MSSQFGEIDLGPVMEVYARSRHGVDGSTIEGKRLSCRQIGELLPASPAAQTQAVTIDSDIPGIWTRTPGCAKHRVVLYLHGGGYLVGSAEDHAALAEALSAGTSSLCLAIDYRLAPETPYPGAIEDCVRTYKWLLAEGYQSQHIALAGDSAGAGLVFATLISLRDQSVALPAAAYCLSPWLDCSCSLASHTELAGVDPLMSTAITRACAEAYLQGESADSPLASPVFADLTGLPPVCLQVGSREILLDDSVTMARNAGKAGVHVDLQVWPGMVHVWQRFVRVFEPAKLAVEAGCGFLNSHLAP